MKRNGYWIPAASVRHRQEAVGEEVERHRIEVELVDQHDVGCDPLDDLGDVVRLDDARARQVGGRQQVGPELAGVVPVERRVERREADRGETRLAVAGLRHGRGRRSHQCDAECGKHRNSQ